MKKLPVLGILTILTIFAAYFITRTINLIIIPIFTDEAIYLRWAQIALTDPKWRFISLIDGKQPLLIWIFLPVLKIISDPLIAGRMVSIFLGFTGLIGLASFGAYLTRSFKGFIIGALLYLLSPFILQYDRLAIYEALLLSISIWSLFFTYLLGRTLRLDMALILGSFIGAGLLTKSSATYFLLLMPASILLINFTQNKKILQLIKISGLMVVVFIQAKLYETILRLSEFRHIIGQKNLTFIYSFSEFFADPFKNAWGNFVGLSSWLISYLTFPVVILMLVSTIWLLKKNWKQAVFFSLWFVVPFITLDFFGRVIYPRFLLFMVPPLLLMLLLFINEQFRKVNGIKSILLLIIFFPSIIFIYKILYDPVHAPFPYADRQQFINDWPAGYGISEVIDYLKKEAQNGHVTVATEGTFGLFPMALELYLGKDPNVTFVAIWPVGEVPKNLQELAKKEPVYFVFKERQDVPDEWPLKLVAKYQRGDGSTYLNFYRVLPNQIY